MGRALRDGGRSGDQVEFLEPRDFAFGGDAPADFAGFDLDDEPEPDDGEPRSKWLAGTAGVVIVALVAVGVVAAAPWDGSGGEAVPTSTSAPPTSTPSTTTTPTTLAPGGELGTATVPGFVFDPLPEGLTISGAWDAGGTEPDPRGWAEIWASPDASRAEGRWFSLVLGFEWYDDYTSEATRIDVGRRVAFLGQRTDGTLVLTTPIDHGASTHSLSVTSFGLSTAELTALTASIVVDSVLASGIPQPGFSEPALLDGFVQIAARPSDQDLLWSYIAPNYGTSTSYTDGDGERLIDVRVSPRDDSLAQLARLALGPATVNGPLVVPAGLPADSDLTLGAITGWGPSPYSLARWHDGDLMITVMATTSMDELVQLLPTLRPTTDREWRVTQRRAQDRVFTPDDDLGPPTGPSFDLGSGTLPSGDEWHVTFHQPEWINLMTANGGYGVPLRAVDRVLITTFPSFTLLTASIDPASPAVTMRVSVGGTVVAEAPIAPLTDLDPTIEYPGKIGVLTFDQVGVFVVELLDATGAVVDTVPSPGFDR